jgi:hypothetical protein
VTTGAGGRTAAEGSVLSGLNSCSEKISAGRCRNGCGDRIRKEWPIRPEEAESEGLFKRVTGVTPGQFRMPAKNA